MLNLTKNARRVLEARYLIRDAERRIVAWELGLKGITIYRYGSKSTQVLELGVHEEAHQYDHASRCDPEECKIGQEDA